MSSIFDDNIDIYNGIKDEIKNFIKSNYFYDRIIIISDKPNKNGLYEVSSNGSVYVADCDITSLTNNIFEWSRVNESFSCSGCKKLKSLKGAPKQIGIHFNCSNCINLQSLEGAPNTVGKDFVCFNYVTKFTENDIKAISNVGGTIFCNS